MKRYHDAAVCRRGHVVSGNLITQLPSPRCGDCGAVVLTRCESCSTRIRGREYQLRHGRAFDGLPYKQPPDFCDECGAPHAWASRQARIYELENVLDEQDLDEASRLSIHEQLEALQDPNLSEEEQAERWTRIKKLAPGFLEAGGRIVESVVTTAVKAQLGL